MIILKHPQTGEFMVAYWGNGEFETSPNPDDAMVYYDSGLESKRRETKIEWLVVETTGDGHPIIS